MRGIFETLFIIRIIRLLKCFVWLKIELISNTTAEIFKSMHLNVHENKGHENFFANFWSTNATTFYVPVLVLNLANFRNWIMQTFYGKYFANNFPNLRELLTDFGYRLMLFVWRNLYYMTANIYLEFLKHYNGTPTTKRVRSNFAPKMPQIVSTTYAFLIIIKLSLFDTKLRKNFYLW